MNYVVVCVFSFLGVGVIAWAVLRGGKGGGF